MRGMTKVAERDQRGAVMVIVALALVVLCGAAALSIDLGNGWQTRRGLITGTDAAALAAAQTYARGGTGCDADAIAYLSANQADAVLVSCVNTPLGPTTGFVTVTARQNVETFFGPVIGFNDYEVTSTSSALYGPLRELTGLRPFGLCLDGSAALQSYIANPVATTIRIEYTKDQPDACAAEDDLPGNWGTIDFNGGANSNAETKDWVLNGYPDGVSGSDHTVTSCVGEPHCYEGDTGAIAGLQSQIQTLQNNGTWFTLPIFNFGEGNGGNVEFHLVAFIRVRIIDFKVNGAESQRFFEFEVDPDLVTGTCCGGSAIDTGLRGVALCAVDPADTTACVLRP